MAQVDLQDVLRMKLSDLMALSQDELIDRYARHRTKDDQRRTMEVWALRRDPAAMDALRRLADGPHPTRALMAVLDDLRPPF